MASPPHDFRRILVLDRSRIGDCLLTTPTLRALRRGFPRAHLGVAIPAGNRELLAENPHLDEIVLRPERTRWWEKARFILTLRRWEADLIVSFQEKSLFYAWATAFQRRAWTVCLDHPRTRRFYRQTVPIPVGRHEVEKYLAVARALGCEPDEPPRLELAPPAAARATAARLLAEAGARAEERWIGINPGGIKANKRWPIERFAEVAARLQRELGMRALVVGGAGDVRSAEAIRERCLRLGGAAPLLVAGRTTLGETAACLERCDLFVTGDTGPMHMAAALGVPVVAIFGPTDPRKFGPYTPRGVVIRHPGSCGRCAGPCVHTVTVDEVVAAALSLYRADTATARPATR